MLVNSRWIWDKGQQSVILWRNVNRFFGRFKVIFRLQEDIKSPLCSGSLINQMSIVNDQVDPDSQLGHCQFGSANALLC
jgi:hypothetical protein